MPAAFRHAQNYSPASSWILAPGFWLLFLRRVDHLRFRTSTLPRSYTVPCGTRSNAFEGEDDDEYENEAARPTAR